MICAMHYSGDLVGRAAASFRMTKRQLAETAGVAPATLRPAHGLSPRVAEVMEVVDRISNWAGGPIQAMAWYRSQPLPEFGGRTAESLVKAGKVNAVRDWLYGVASGGFA